MVEVVGDHGDGLVTVSIAGRYQVVRRSSLKQKMELNKRLLENFRKMDYPTLLRIFKGYGDTMKNPRKYMTKPTMIDYNTLVYAIQERRK